MRKVKIATRLIGSEEPVFVVAEVGTTSNGDLPTALKLVDAAREAGADAIKFMILGPDYFMSDRTVTYEYQWAGGRHVENMYEMFKKLMFTEEEWFIIRDHCRQREIIFYATVDYLQGVDLAERLDVAAYKLSSWDITYLPLIEKVGSTGKPIQLDLGPATLADVEKALQVLDRCGNDHVILVYCTHATSQQEVNLRSVPYLQEAFRGPVGYSADSMESTPDIAAVALGAHMIEKRLTLSRSYFGHHHIQALEPGEFKEYVATLRRVEDMLGQPRLKPSSQDVRLKELYYVSIVADRPIPAGTVITREMLACKRPGTGIAPECLRLIVGRKARREIACNQILGWDDI
jgi:sialic acid synthase SpsE